MLENTCLYLNIAIVKLGMIENIITIIYRVIDTVEIRDSWLYSNCVTTGTNIESGTINIYK